MCSHDADLSVMRIQECKVLRSALNLLRVPNYIIHQQLWSPIFITDIIACLQSSECIAILTWQQETFIAKRGWLHVLKLMIKKYWSPKVQFQQKLFPCPLWLEMEREANTDSNINLLNLRPPVPRRFVQDTACNDEEIHVWLHDEKSNWPGSGTANTI